MTQPALHILLADDDENLRQLLATMLELAGHTVAMAADGAEALSLFTQSRFDVVLTDLLMPRLNGLQLAEAVKASQPGQVLVILTGFSEIAFPDGSPPPGVDLLLKKPIRLEALSRALGHVAGKGLNSAAWETAPSFLA